jgi:hypothetical protein
MTVNAGFHESTADITAEQVPLSHLSVELGHLYMEDYAAGPEALHRHFRAVAPWLAATREALAAELPAGATPRISTCFLVDDYFSRFSTPAEVVPRLVDAAAASGLRIDYLARESACAGTEEAPVATIVQSGLVADPPPDTNGSRPPASEIGWLCNGLRSPQARPRGMGAMQGTTPWAPPRENGYNRHSIFIDVELWSEAERRRLWSCPFLAAVWQLLRLGALRDKGKPVLVAEPAPESYPKDWDELPAICQVDSRAKPFSAYRTVSVLAPRYLPVEHAVRTILSQVALDPQPSQQAMARAQREGLALAPEFVERIGYVFAGH